MAVVPVRQGKDERRSAETERTNQPKVTKIIAKTVLMLPQAWLR